VVRGRRTSTTEGCNEGVAVLRPEDARLGAISGDANTFTVQVTEKVFLGDKVVCVGAFESGDSCEFWVAHEQDAQVGLGDSLEVSWSCEQTALVEA
jgi:hypothetical protein